MLKRSSALFILVFFTSINVSAQFTEQTISPVPLHAAVDGSVAWGDYNNDGLLDILLTGSGVTKIYRNFGNNEFKEQLSALVPGLNLYSGTAVWGDYDNDGDLDIAIIGAIGLPSTVKVAKIYRNDGGNPVVFREIATSMIGVCLGSLAWGDYNNDGRLDLLVTGDTTGFGYKGVSRIYRNEGHDIFTEQTAISLADVAGSSVAWGDYDKDGDLDILLTGVTAGGDRVSKIYRNNYPLNTFTEQPMPSLIGVNGGSVAWGDYDNDGDLDILLTGYSDESGSVTKIYRNDGGMFIPQTISPMPLTNVSGSSVAWGDYDNDGDLDIIMTGMTVINSTTYSKVYRNDGGNVFVEVMMAIPFSPVSNSSVAWGDYDNDGDLDLLLSGSLYYPANSGYYIKLYRNDSKTQNHVPSAPRGLTSTVNGNNVTFQWDMSTDAETSQHSLRYNLVIATSQDDVNRLSPMADRGTGYRRVIDLGNTNHRTSWTITGFSGGVFGKRYYWSVQSIDNAFAGSRFNRGASFWVPGFFNRQNWPIPVILAAAIAMMAFFFVRRRKKQRTVS